MEKVKILEPFEYVRNETPEELEAEEKNESWADLKLTAPACISAAGLEPC